LDNEKGFFVMVEGGKIDWASHDNDAGTIVQEVVDFDNAILEAYNFYMLHPDETLIIVTADHETGGVSLGNYSNDYDSNFSLLGMQKSSVTLFSELLDTYKQSTTNYDINHVYEMAASSFYTNPITYTHEDSIKISEAFDFYFLGQKNFTEKELYTKFGSSNAVAIAFSKILSDRAGVGFTTWSHTAAKVPVYTIGRKGPYFSGSLDNTDFNRKIVEIMGW
jgi:alkaline phosphatase